MDMYHHGGSCCGISTIYIGGMSIKPGSKLGVRVAASLIVGIYPISHRGLVFPERELPAETALERMKRLITMREKSRPKGIIEVVLCDFRTSTHPVTKVSTYNQLPMWENHLLELDFKRVSECMNSNSGNRIYVYHRCKE